MSTSIAQLRRQLSALIAAAQHTPQVISKRNKPVAVLVSADYFAQCEQAAAPTGASFYRQLLQLRETYPPQDDAGLVAPESAFRQAAWQRTNAFVEPA